MTYSFTYFAFDTIRRSKAAYAWASRDARGVVRFHQTETAARRNSFEVQPVTFATAEQVAADKARKREQRAAEAARAAAFEARWRSMAS